MNKTGLMLIGIVAIIGITKILYPASIMPLFTLDAVVAMFAVLAAVIAYGIWFGPLRFLSGSYILGSLGLASLLFAVGSIASPTLLGTRDSFVPLADVFMMLETGIVLSMIGLEKKPERALSPLLVFSLVWQLVQRRLQRVHSSVPASQ